MIESVPIFLGKTSESHCCLAELNKLLELVVDYQSHGVQEMVKSSKSGDLKRILFDYSFLIATIYHS